MAEKKETVEAAVAEATKAQEEINTINEQAVEAIATRQAAMDEADREIVAAEVRAGKTIAQANEQLENARKRAEEKKLKALGAIDDEGYISAMWGGNVKLQCVWCPWDVIGSPTGDFDPFERMREHLAAAEKTTHSGPARYGRNGLPL